MTAKNFKLPSQVEIKNPEQHIADLSGKASLELEATIERGLGYVPREVLTNEKVDIGTIALDATFTPIRRVNYEVENMRVGDRTDFNRLRILIETNGTITPREALEKSIEIMIHQLKAVIGFQEEACRSYEKMPRFAKAAEDAAPAAGATKIKIADSASRRASRRLLRARALRAPPASRGNRRARSKELDGIGEKAIEEISEALAGFGLTLKSE